MLKYFAVFFLVMGVFTLTMATTPVSSASQYVRVGNLNEKRYDHTSTLLDDGRVLLVGGAYEAGKTAEVYDPKARKFTNLPELHAFHRFHTTTKLQDGRVLILGGYQDGLFVNPSNVAEIFDPKTNQITQISNFPTTIENHTATLLRDGRVAIVYEDKVYLYNPQTDEFTLWGKLSFRRRRQSAVLLADGKLLVVGGIGVGVPDEEANKELPIGDIIDFQSNKVLNAHYTISIWAYYRNPMFLLKDNRVFLCNEDSAYIFSVDGTKVEKVKVANVKREKLLKGVLLPNGKIFLVGDEFWPEVLVGSDDLFSSAWRPAKTGPIMSEIYDPETGKITEAGPPKYRRPEDYAMMVLKDGSVLITGGRFYPKKAELYLK